MHASASKQPSAHGLDCLLQTSSVFIHNLSLLMLTVPVWNTQTAENVIMCCDLYLTPRLRFLCGLPSAILTNLCKNSSMHHWYSLPKFKRPEMFPAYVRKLAFTLSDPIQQVVGAAGVRLKRVTVLSGDFQPDAALVSPHFGGKWNWWVPMKLPYLLLHFK